MIDNHLLFLHTCIQYCECQKPKWDESILQTGNLCACCLLSLFVLWNLRCCHISSHLFVYSAVFLFDLSFKKLDLFLFQILGSCPVDVMPGFLDPSNNSMPQQVGCTFPSVLYLYLSLSLYVSPSLCPSSHSSLRKRTLRCVAWRTAAHFSLSCPILSALVICAVAIERLLHSPVKPVQYLSLHHQPLWVLPGASRRCRGWLEFRPSTTGPLRFSGGGHCSTGAQSSYSCTLVTPLYYSVPDTSTLLYITLLCYTVLCCTRVTWELSSPGCTGM